MICRRDELNNPATMVMTIESLKSCDKVASVGLWSQFMRVHIKVVDGTGNTTFLLWDQVTQELTGKSVALCESLVLDIVIINKDDGKFETPKDVDDLTGRELLFRVSVENRHLVDGFIHTMWICFLRILFWLRCTRKLITG